MNCRINRQRQWTARLLLELETHAKASFVTLTYDEEHLPVALCEGEPRAVLNGKDLTLWLKRFRNKFGPYRYFAVGEYGSKTDRPHYHAILFGVDPGYGGEIQETWGQGFTSAYEVNSTRCAYIAHYTTKKWLAKTTEALQGRPPEMSRQSRKPGIGVPFIPALANAYETKSGSLILSQGQLQTTIRIGGKTYPLDRTMMLKLREALGLPSSFGKLDTTTEEEMIEAVKEAQQSEAKLTRRAQNHGTL